MKKYEYTTVRVFPKGLVSKVDTDELEAMLNEMGQEGWQLAGTPTDRYSSGTIHYIICVFMREIV
ncbi:MAG: DUF4177 domain-containing protein [Defluviitaleaceae bacterium]|nr:DUF4177 domain-containing protein [Defluviitaleaceae bacterium]